MTLLRWKVKSRKKIKDVDTSALVKKIDYNRKITEMENKKRQRINWMGFKVKNWQWRKTL